MGRIKAAPVWYLDAFTRRYRGARLSLDRGAIRQLRRQLRRANAIISVA
jgi:hypothetical protein